MRWINIFLVLAIMLVPVAYAHGNETFENAEHIMSENIPCSNLTDDQLADIGDYFMEQMHPGEAHERMDAMMGGEGSESLKQMHIGMAMNFYCADQADSDINTNTYNGYGMMGRPGMMGSYYDNAYDNAYRRSIFTPLTILFGLLIIVLAGALIFLALRKNDEDDAMSILRKRYAKGELSKKEFEKRKKELKK